MIGMRTNMGIGSYKLSRRPSLRQKPAAHGSQIPLGNWERVAKRSSTGASTGATPALESRVKQLAPFSGGRGLNVYGLHFLHINPP